MAHPSAARTDEEVEALLQKQYEEIIRNNTIENLIRDNAIEEEDLRSGDFGEIVESMLQPQLFSLTQNVGSKGGSMSRGVPTIIRNSVLWSQQKERWALGDELFAMQGVPMWDRRPWPDSFWQTVTEGQKRQLAGDPS